jgi:hypothetical protein
LRAGEPGGSKDARKGHALPRRVAEELAATIGQRPCPRHGQKPTILVLEANGDARIEASCCCEQARQRLLRELDQQIRRRPSLSRDVASVAAAGQAHPPTNQSR